MDPFKIILMIAHQIEPLNPPVFEFEDTIGKNPFKVLISVLLSARTKDTTTIKAVKRLFEKANNPIKMNRLTIKEIEQLIYPVGFFHQKAKNIKKILNKIAENNTISNQLDELTNYPGVGNKTANLVLAIAFNKATIAVDTHVYRISKRLGFTDKSKINEVEEDLKKIFRKEHWKKINKILVGFGQTICKPRQPECQICNINRDCRYWNSQS